MEEPSDRAISDVLDRLEEAVNDDSVSVQEIVEHLGPKSFPALILVPTLISASPASAIPGLTSAVGLIVALVAAQMIWGRECAWLPGFLARRRVPSDRMCHAIGWLRRPVRFVERFLRPRLTFLLKRPWLFLPLLVMLGLALFMPVMEVIPTSGSIASVAIAFFAAGLLTRDGALILIGLAVVVAIGVVVQRVGFA